MNQPRSRLELARLADPVASDDEHMRRIAAGLIDELEIVEPPVDVELVASWLGIHRITRDAALPVSGCLIHSNGRFEIRVRSDEVPGRQRFTIGHECAHTFFPGFARRSRYRCSPESTLGESSDTESLCDIAAAELVMPARFFVPDARSAGFGLAGLEAVAQRYGTSLEATGRRFVESRKEPAALLVFSVRQKPNEEGTSAPPRLRLDYAHTTGDWPYFLRHKSATHRDVFGRALDGETVSARTTITGISAAPVHVDIYALHCPVVIDGEPRDRVVALARRAWGRSR